MDKYLIDSHKLFWHLDRVSLWQKDRMIVPLYLEISPVAYCNHSCIFCAYDFAKKSSLELDTEVICKRLGELGRMGVRSILYSGEGEPLLHKDLPRLIDCAKKSGIDVALATNGSLGSFKLWQEVLPRLTWVRFSLDAATPEVYALVHKVSKGTFSKTIKSIKDAVEVKRKGRLGVAIGVQFLVLEENFKDLEAAIKLVMGIQADYISIKPYSLHPLMKAKKEVSYARDLTDKIDAIVKKNKGKSKTAVIFRKEAMETYMRKEKKFSCCRAMPFWGHISAAGDFFTCGVFVGDNRFMAGNIYKEDMQSIIYGPKRKAAITYGQEKIDISGGCRLNCRMGRINEFLEYLENKPDHLNFI